MELSQAFLNTSSATSASPAPLMVEQQSLTSTKHSMVGEGIQQVPLEQHILPQVHSTQTHATPRRAIWSKYDITKRQSIARVAAFLNQKNTGLRKHQQESPGDLHLKTMIV